MKFNDLTRAPSSMCLLWLEAKCKLNFFTVSFNIALFLKPGQYGIGSGKGQLTSLQISHILNTNSLDFSPPPQRLILPPGFLSDEHHEHFTARVVSYSALKQNKRIWTTITYLLFGKKNKMGNVHSDICPYCFFSFYFLYSL
ncbi:hypothetical protein GOODEAATRI_023525 [Goodea atripinnis]|uniref:Uncharacterized protein n=1 Tax=Goodea atripinnis TaxID=208336 RepID=A0ABV0N3S7_9TELE